MLVRRTNRSNVRMWRKGRDSLPRVRHLAQTIPRKLNCTSATNWIILFGRAMSELREEEQRIPLWKFTLIVYLPIETALLFTNFLVRHQNGEAYLVNANRTSLDQLFENVLALEKKVMYLRFDSSWKTGVSELLQSRKGS